MDSGTSPRKEYVLSGLELEKKAAERALKTINAKIEAVKRGEVDAAEGPETPRIETSKSME